MTDCRYDRNENCDDPVAALTDNLGISRYRSVVPLPTIGLAPNCCSNEAGLLGNILLPFDNFGVGIALSIIMVACLGCGDPNLMMPRLSSKLAASNGGAVFANTCLCSET